MVFISLSFDGAVLFGEKVIIKAKLEHNDSMPRTSIEAITNSAQTEVCRCWSTCIIPMNLIVKMLYSIKKDYSSNFSAFSLTTYTTSCVNFVNWFQCFQ